jgi:hypothetical protein
VTAAPGLVSPHDLSPRAAEQRRGEKFYCGPVPGVAPISREAATATCADVAVAASRLAINSRPLSAGSRWQLSAFVASRLRKSDKASAVGSDDHYIALSLAGRSERRAGGDLVPNDAPHCKTIAPARQACRGVNLFKFMPSEP